ncbi:MAG TPA: hypothetical protein VF278_17950 [Pirellulales bacterium]
MWSRSSTCWPAGLLLGGLLMGNGALAAGPVAVNERAVDMVTLVDGKQWLGLFAQPPEKEPSADSTVTLYVAREWLRKHQPAYYRKFVAGEEAQCRAALEQYRQGLREWGDRRSEPKLLHDFIERSLRDVESRLRKEKPFDAAGASQLCLVELSAKQVKRWHAQPENVRRLLALAWETRLPDAEDLAAGELSERLKRQGVDVEHGEPDLSDRLGIVALSPRQWAAKVALIEFEILGKPRFQGTGGTLLEADDPAKQPPLADVLGGLLQDQLGDVLGDLLNPQPGDKRSSAKSKEQAAIEKALVAAAEKKATGTRITYLDQDLGRRRVTVTDTFHALMPDGTWQPIWQTSATFGIDGEAKAAEALAADPQVAEIMRTIKALGLDANQDLLKSALRFGAATQRAMQATEGEFADFLRRHTRRLIGSPVPLSVSQPNAQPE